MKRNDDGSHTFVGEGINEAYYKALETLVCRPRYTPSPRGMKINELIDTTIKINNPRRRIITYADRGLSLKYLAGELAFYFSGSRKLKFIAHYSKFWNQVSDNGRTVNSCYGYKLFTKRSNSITQFEYARQQLLDDPDTRKAIMIIYTSENTKLDSHDNPCTMYLQFFIRDWQLILHAYMRSNDIWFGVSYDIPFFTMLQEMMLQTLKQMNYERFEGLVIGPYYHHSGSLHLYERNMAQAKELVKDPITWPVLYCKEEMPPLTLESLDEIGIFLKYEKSIRKATFYSNVILKDPAMKCLLDYLVSGKYK